MKVEFDLLNMYSVYTKMRFVNRQKVPYIYPPFSLLLIYEIRIFTLSFIKNQERLFPLLGVTCTGMLFDQQLVASIAKEYIVRLVKTKGASLSQYTNPSSSLHMKELFSRVRL